MLLLSIINATSGVALQTPSLLSLQFEASSTSLGTVSTIMQLYLDNSTYNVAWQSVLHCWSRRPLIQQLLQSFRIDFVLLHSTSMCNVYFTLGILQALRRRAALRRCAALRRRVALRRRLITVLYYLNTVLTIPVPQLRSRRR